MNKEPVMVFTSDEQMWELLAEWKTRLFLDDWVIKVKRVKSSSLKDSNGNPLQGRNEFQFVNKTAFIAIADLTEEERDCIAKCCVEQTLVHELLHCKYNWLGLDYDRYEQAYLDTIEHSMLEQLAKSLIMAKYNLPFSWFENFSQGDKQTGELTSDTKSRGVSQ